MIFSPVKSTKNAIPVSNNRNKINGNILQRRCNLHDFDRTAVITVRKFLSNSAKECQHQLVEHNFTNQNNQRSNYIGLTLKNQIPP